MQLYKYMLRCLTGVMICIALLGCTEKQATSSAVEPVQIQKAPTPAPSSGKVITIVADEWMPYNGLPDSDLPGFMVEFARYAFEPLGYTVEYKVIPWSRAVKGTLEGVYDGLIGSELGEAPGLIFPEEEQGRSVHSFFTPKNASWRYNGIDSLKDITLGVIDGYAYGTLYENFIIQHIEDPHRIQVMCGNNALECNIKKMLAGRIDSLIEDRATFHYHTSQNNTNELFTEAGIYGSVDIYIAFSPKHPESKKLANALSTTMIKLRNTGTLDEILEKYGEKDWNK